MRNNEITNNRNLEEIILEKSNKENEDNNKRRKNINEDEDEDGFYDRYDIKKKNNKSNYAIIHDKNLRPEIKYYTNDINNTNNTSVNSTNINNTNLNNTSNKGHIGYYLNSIKNNNKKKDIKKNNISNYKSNIKSNILMGIKN